MKSGIERMIDNRGRIYILWDISSQDRIFIPNYCKYPKRAVLSVTPDELMSILETLYEDVYFFDDSLKWSITFMHEEIKDKKESVI